MLLKIDYNFNLKYVLRFLFLQKYPFITNTFAMPYLNILLLFFSINEVEQLDDPRTFNYFFLFRFFFGKKSFFTKFFSFFSYNRNFYNFNVQIFFKKIYCFFPLFFLVNDLLPLTNINFLSWFFNPTKHNIFILRFFDMNLFLEKKTNAGLYNLVNNLNYKFFFECSDYDSCELLLILFKVL